MLLPLGIGLAIGRWSPAARRWVPTTLKASMLVLLVGAVAGVPYMLWRKRRRAGPPRGVRPAARVEA
jgi:hypothetical protein